MIGRQWGRVTLVAGVLCWGVAQAQGQSVWDKVKQKAKDRAAAQVTGAQDAPADQNPPPAPPEAAQGDSAPAETAAAPTTIRAYQNYDFVPGETILFADDFTGTQDGEFPSQWELKKGQAVVNKVAGSQALLLTDGNYAVVSPRIKSPNYLEKRWTLEFDTFDAPGGNTPVLLFGSIDGEASLSVGDTESLYHCECNGAEISLSGTFPTAIQAEAFHGKWHHVAVAYNQPQMKVYVDQYRVLTVPDAHYAPPNFFLAGIGEQEKPVIYRNVRVAAGGGMNLVGKKFTDAKIVTHGINFDVDRATIRPESMGVLNQIKAVMDGDASLKFEIDGHTDNSGTAAHNQQLSQQRADAVKSQLVLMGVDQSRLTTRGFGDTKPVGPNTSPEGKANNRRVEFVRM